MPERQNPALIAVHREVVRAQTVHESTAVELVQEVIARAEDWRASLDASVLEQVGAKVGEVARDISLAITHLEDARTRLNAAGYRCRGTFSISDSERTQRTLARGIRSVEAD
jgi:hypothetical protein